MYNKVALILLTSSLFTACGGGGGGSTGTPTPTTSSAALSSTPVVSSSSSSNSSSSAAAVVILQGQFKDNNVTGLQFISGNQSGVTNASGTFTYEQGKTVTFSIGALTLGTAQGKELITPIDLITDGSSDDVAVQNLVRLLIMLDADGYTPNGIQISSAVQTAANSWAQVDFSSVNFSSDVINLMAAATAADSGAHSLPDAAAAKMHLDSTHRCSYSGAYKGISNTAANEHQGFIVDALEGNVSGVLYSDANNGFTEFTNITKIQPKQQISFSIGNNSTTYAGEFTSLNTITGTWQKNNDKGTFTATRLARTANAIYRFSASYTGTTSGLFTFDIDQANKITGSHYDVKTNTEESINGTLIGTKLTATTAKGIQIQGMLSTDTGTLSGTWSDTSKGASGSFSGSGCQLNPVPLSINGFRSFKTGRDTGTVQLIPASGTDPLILLDGIPVVRVRMNVNPWGEMSFPISGFDQTGEAAQVSLASSRFIDITYQSNQSVNLQLRQYAVHGGTHNQITLPAAATFTTVRIPFSDFKGGLSTLDLTKVAKFNFALLSNNPNDGYAELIVKNFKIENFN
ncbi:MAG: hypothetical protein AAGC78_05905 [Cellvibrio sp.]|uniref:hypothetical protein n=1 Tax=Cellvibrio sp. TaxID=1965322 RepID=UPI00319FD38A